MENFPKDKLSAREKLRLERLIVSIRESVLVYQFKLEAAKKQQGKKNDFDAAAKKLWDLRVENKLKFPDIYPNIVRRSEKSEWAIYQPYRDASGNDGAKLNDLAAGWRNSFDEPSLQGWRARDGFHQLTNKESSFDRFSIQVKDTKKSLIVIQRPRIAVTPGAKYTLSYDVKSPATAKFRCRVVCNGKTLANIGAVATSEHWKQGKGTFTIPADGNQISLYIYVSDAPKGGFIDNVVLTRK